MRRVYIPSTGPEGWRQLLAKPDLQWATGYSARTLANSWEAADGLPPEVEAILCAALGPVELLLALPEHKTPLPGGDTASQSDVLAIARHPAGLVVCTVEGKVNEPFADTVGKWLVDASSGKLQRLAYICRLLGIDSCPPDVHYQLLHRTASALIEAERFQAADAAMIVHSFSPERRWFEAFARFVGLLGGEAQVGVPAVVTVPGGRSLVLGWACGDQQFRSL